MSELANPYIAGAPVVESSMFFGREDVFKWIERSLAGKFVDHILVIHGQRRVGKTSVLKQIPNYLPKNYIQVFFDLQGRTSTTFDRFLWWLASEIARTIKKERGIDLPRPDRAAFEDPEYLINEFIPSLKPVLGEQILILTFDEFDTLDRSEIQESLARPLIAYLRRMMELEGLNFIFSIGSSGDKLENMQASYTDFFKTALYRKISFLTQEDCQRLVTKPVEGSIEYDPQAVKRIFEITSGHPYFTQLMCHELFALCQKTGSRVIGSENVEAVLGDVIERGTVNLKFVWDEASDLEKWILAGLAKLEGDGSNHKLAQLLHNQRVRFSDPDLNAAVIHLRDKDILTESNRFVIHLMRMWLLANRPLDRVREELAEVNPIANRYIEIGDEYRDRGQTVQAIESYRQALKADPANLRAQTSIGQIFLDTQDYHQAITAFEQAIQMDDEDVSARGGYCAALLAQGDLEQQAGQTEAALRAFEQVLIANPAHRDACRRLARIYTLKAEELLKAGQDDAALSAFNKAIDYTPDDDTLAARYDEVLTNKKAQVITSLIEKADRSITRQKWDEATTFIEEAIKLEPQNEELKAKLLKTKDAPRQYKIQAYRQEAELALKRKNYPKAIESIETALQLSPGEPSLTDWLDSLRADQRDEQVLLIKEQLKRAVTAADWAAAMTAIQQGKNVAPGAENWERRLSEIEIAKREFEQKALREKADSALKSEDWDRAIEALTKLDESDSGNANINVEIANIRSRKREAALSTLKTSAVKFGTAEKWAEAINAWEEYLANQPTDADQASEELEKAKAQANLAAEYQTALENIRAKRFDKAIFILQAIIAKDPTYKSTSRLLVEAVEARKAAPPSRGLKFAAWAVIGVLLLAGIGYAIYWAWNNLPGLPEIASQSVSSTQPAVEEKSEGSIEPNPVATQSNLDPLIENALIHMRYTSAQILTEFDDWDLVTSAKDADITNGVMRIASFDEQGSFFRLPNYPSHNFAVEFMLGIPDDQQTEGLCVYEAMSNAIHPEPGWRSFSAEFYPSEDLFALSAYNPQTGEQPRLTSTEINMNVNNLITLIVIGDQISALINGEFAFTVQDPSGGANYYGNNLAAYNQVLCDFSSFKYWDLRDIDSELKTTLLQSYNQAPFYESGFESWDFEDFAQNVTLQNEQLVIQSTGLEHQSTKLLHLNAESFMVEYDLQIEGSDPGGTCGFFSYNTDDDNDPNQRSSFLTFTTNGYGIVRHQPDPSDPSDSPVNDPQFSFDPGKTNRVSQIYLKNQISTFINGELVNTSTDPRGEYIYQGQRLFAQAPDDVTCRFDNYRIWDLSSSDLANIRPALEVLKNDEPDYQTEFNASNSNDLNLPVRIDAGKLIVTSDNQSYVDYYPAQIATDSFAVDFEVGIEGAERDGHCGFGVTNRLSGEENRSIGISISSDGTISVGHAVFPDSYPDLAIQPGAAAVNKTNRITMIVIGEKISVISNGILVISAPNPDKGTMFNRMYLLANYTAKCEYDNFKYWDLSDTKALMEPPSFGNIDYFDTILDSIEGKSPSFEEYFDPPSYNWSQNLNSSGNEYGYYEGSYLISAIKDCNGVNLPNDMDYTDFVIDLDLTFMNNQIGTFLLSYRNQEEGDHFAANVHSNGSVSFHKNIGGVHIPIIGSESLAATNVWSKTKHFTLIVKQNRAAIFINNQLMVAIRDDIPDSGPIIFAVCDGNPQKILIDNLKIWDLNDLQY